MAGTRIEAVIVDWGGTLTRWHHVDFHAESVALGQAVRTAPSPAACVYVGDLLFDDVWGAHNAGLRTIHVPLSSVPPGQVGHTDGEPDASVTSLAQIPDVVRSWDDAGSPG